MAKFFLSLLVFLLAFVECRAAANNVSDEFLRLRNLDNKTLISRGYMFVEKAMYDSCMVYYSMVVNRYYDKSYRKQDIPDIVKAMQNLGVIYMTFSYDFKKSYYYLLEAKELAEDNHYYEKLPNIYNCIANILQLSRDVGNSSDGQEVVDMLRKSFSTALKMKDYSVMSIAMNNLVTVTFGRSGKKLDISRDIAVFRKVCSDRKAPDVRQALLMCSAYECLRNGDREKALEWLNRAVSEDVDYPFAYRGVLSCLELITKVYIIEKNYSKALESMRKSLEIAKENNSLDYVTTLYSDLSKLYARLGDTVMANRYELLYLRSNQRLQGEGRLSSVKNVKFMRELNKANDQVRELSEKRRLQNIFLMCALVVVVVVVFLLYRIFRANRKIRYSNRHLYQNYVEMLGKEEQARKRRELDGKRIAELEGQLRDATLGSAERQTAAEGCVSTIQKVKYQNSRMTVGDAKELYAAVVGVMENSDEIYKTGFNVERLSELVHSRPRYVSQAINQESGSNFNSLLNDYRIKEACRRLGGNPDYVNMTIEGIAESVGFKSRTNFGSLFKSITGLSPSAYQRMAREK